MVKLAISMLYEHESILHEGTGEDIYAYLMEIEKLRGTWCVANLIKPWATIVASQFVTT